jgi:hypothetical protein
MFLRCSIFMGASKDPEEASLIDILMLAYKPNALV